MTKHLLGILLVAFYGLANYAMESNSDETRDIGDEYFIIIDEQSTQLGTANFSRNLHDMRELEHNIIGVGGQIINKFYLVFTGIHARLSDEALAQIESISIVQKIQSNEYAYLVDSENEPVIPEAVASWGIDRIDQKDLPLNNSYTAPTSATQSHVYVIDSGVRTTHKEFSGRIGNGISTMGDPSLEDCLGHGTHVSGTVLGTTTGVFTNTILHPVRVFGCSGSTTFDVILKGLEWIIANNKKPAVANMSLGATTTSDLLDVAVRNTVASGVTVVVAAGNSTQDACTATPAREPSAITVAASDINDSRSSFSNFGTCVDLFAPGSNINSAYYTSDTAYASLSGTSMASPHVCGGAALVASLHPTWTPQQVSDEITSKATPGKIADARQSPNKLLYVNDFSGGGGNDFIVNAGPDIVQTLPNNKVDLIGSVVTTGSSIVSVTWQQTSGPTAALVHIAGKVDPRLTVYDLVVGTYVFTLSATDSKGRTASDTVTVTIRNSQQNQPPRADAGPDATINTIGCGVDGTSATLDGSQSSDPDSSIVSYRWDIIVGNPDNLAIANPNSVKTQVTAKASGQYTLRLTVTDESGLSATDTIVITANAAPTVNAGPDFTARSTDPSFALNGSATDPEGSPLYYMWFQLGGPNRAWFDNFLSPITTVSGFVKGSYVFRLYAVDSSRAVASDDVVVTVQ